MHSLSKQRTSIVEICYMTWFNTHPKTTLAVGRVWYAWRYTYLNRIVPNCVFTLWPIRKLNKYGEFHAFVFCNLMLVFLRGCRIFSTTPRLNLQIRSDSKSVNHAVTMLSRTAAVALYLLLCINRGEDNMTMNLTMPISSPHSQRCDDTAQRSLLDDRVLEEA